MHGHRNLKHHNTCYTIGALHILFHLSISHTVVPSLSSIPSQSCGSLHFHFLSGHAFMQIFSTCPNFSFPPLWWLCVCLTVCHTSVVCMWSSLHISCCHTCHGKCTALNKFFKRTWWLYAWATSDIVLLHCIRCWLGTRVICGPVSDYWTQRCDSDSTAVRYITLDVHWRFKLKL
jgi:hypothetical protein